MTHLPPVRQGRLVGLALLAMAASPGAALAHAVLIASTPEAGGTIAAGHRALDFSYNSKVDHRRSRLTLTAPDGTRSVLPISSASAANALDAEADLKPGAYTLRWQALALDGHITRGDVPFTAVAK